jgi:hypothetical protein
MLYLIFAGLFCYTALIAAKRQYDVIPDDTIMAIMLSAILWPLLLFIFLVGVILEILHII